MLYPVDFAMNNSVADTDFYMKFLLSINYKEVKP